MFLNNIYLPEQSIFLPFNLSTSSFNLSHISGYALNSLHKDGSDPVLCLYFPFCQNLLSNPVHKELNVWKELLKKKKKMCNKIISNSGVSSIIKRWKILWRRLFSVYNKPHPIGSVIADISMWLWYSVITYKFIVLNYLNFYSYYALLCWISF